jgi:hypothetical protein|tara:strand:- start:2068 stop:2358 length:291 start_codon:yes stop_codon:yes gene_type:complete
MHIGCVWRKRWQHLQYYAVIRLADAANGGEHGTIGASIRVVKGSHALAPSAQPPQPRGHRSQRRQWDAQSSHASSSKEYFDMEMEETNISLQVQYR